MTETDDAVAVNAPREHVYDGIREYDNRLPNWWLMTFYGAVAFSFAYWLYYHTFAIGPDQAEELALQMAAAEAAAERRMASAGALDDDALLALAQDHEAVRRGQEAYGQNCVACHGVKGEGTVGPNLTDAYWIHGPEPTSIYRVVAEGRLEKGMPSWQPVLGAARVRDVTAYLLTLAGTDVPGKEPEGERHETRPAAPAAEDGPGS